MGWGGRGMGEGGTRQVRPLYFSAIGSIFFLILTMLWANSADYTDGIFIFFLENGI